MHCEHELSFLCDVLHKCHLRVELRSPQDLMDTLLYSEALAEALPSSARTIHQAMGRIDDLTKYHFASELMLHYVFLRLPIESERDLLFIGPYLSAPTSPKDMLEIGEELGFPPNAQRFLEDYYASLPVVTENDRLSALIDSFCERVWQTASFSIAEIAPVPTHLPLPVTSFARGTDFNEVLADMKKMEHRYSFENALIHAVSLGQQHRVTPLLSGFDDRMFERRLPDPLRNAKNYCIIMNTLLRKAAEQGGVHPLYIDRSSSYLASKIELSTDIRSIPSLMEEIALSYCRLVRKHATKQYSHVVKKAILLIDADVSAELSLSTIADKIGVSAGYLSAIFKKETGETVSAHIRSRRISYAAHLLGTTSLQIQTIAMHCGILDVQYFSKLFKKQTGKTPNEYRKAARR